MLLYLWSNQFQVIHLESYLEYSSLSHQGIGERKTHHKLLTIVKAQAF